MSFFVGFLASPFPLKSRQKSKVKREVPCFLALFQGLRNPARATPEGVAKGEQVHKLSEQMFGIGGCFMLNKRETALIHDFLSILSDLAKSIMDEVATMEAILEENKEIQRKESEARICRLNKARAKRRAMV
jgi:hypothetical protein